MKRFFTLFLTLMSVLALAVPAFADVIWEPEDSFYEKHRDNCAYINRPYQLAGYDGKVTVYTAPGGIGKATLDNGLQVNIEYTWTGNGATWGYLYLWQEGTVTEGWVPMDDLSKVYDSQQFMEDHTAEITNTESVPAEFHEAVLYSYPNGSAGSVLKEDPRYQPFSEAFSQFYTDESGLRWGYISYYMGRLDSWVCLDDPMNENLNSGIVPAAPSPAQVRGSATVTGGPPALLIASVLVAAVAAATVVLILKQKKRGMEKTSG